MGKQWEQWLTLFFCAPKSLQMVIAAMKLKDAYSLDSAAAAGAKSLQPCPTLCDPIDGSPPGSPIPGILQSSCLENPMDGGARWAAVYGVAQSRTRLK